VKEINGAFIILIPNFNAPANHFRYANDYNVINKIITKKFIYKFKETGSENKLCCMF